jgi:hypothetical protein
MIKIENVEVFGFNSAIRGMRNPMNSWDKSDSSYILDSNDSGLMVVYNLGLNDLSLAKKLCKSGPEHRKFLRMIHVQMDVTVPLYWWKEFDTYKVGTVVNSCSTMHKIHSKEFTLDDFSCEHLLKLPDYTDIPSDVKDQDKLFEYLDDEAPYYICVGMDIPISPLTVLKTTIRMLNRCRKLYLETKDKKYWWQMIQLLPSSYNQKRTLDFNYETAMTIIRQRTGHKLDEWHIFVDALKELPYMKEFMDGENGQ